MSILRLFLFLAPLPLLCGSTTVLFNPLSTTVGPFPSNALTSPENTQKTGIVVQLPAAADTCAPLPALSAPSVCSNVSLLNQLDGFSVNPRIMVCFSAAINPSTLAGGIAISPLSGGSAVSINQVIFDPISNCAFAKPNQVLNQQSQYLLTVTSGVHDNGGQPVAANTAYRACLTGSDAYCSALSAALKTLSLRNVVAASLFTTMSATTWLEQARNAVNQTLYWPALTEATFSLSNLKNITWVPQDLTGTTANQENIPLSALTGVGSIAFGLFTTLNYISPTDGTIHTTPTAQPISAPYYPVPVSFHVFEPATSAPPAGYPVVIYGHGLGDNQFGAPTYIASTLAQNGFATLGFEITGHGYGPFSYVSLTTSSGFVIPVPTPGRGILLPGNSSIGATDGCIVPGAVAVRDCGRQTAVDLVALVKAIQQTPGLNLDPTRIYYVGQSFGGTYGTMFQALDTNVTTAVLNGAGGTSADVARLAITGRPLAEAFLASLAPPPAGLLNVPPALPEPYFHDFFNDNYPLRDAAPVVNSVPGAMAIQAAFEAVDWLGMLGDPLSFAPHLQSANRLAGVPLKSTLFQFGFGDLEVPNPTESAVIAAAGAQSNSWFFRFDLAAYNHPELLSLTYPGVAPLPILPHRILANPTLFSVLAPSSETSIALAEQQQVAAFLKSNGTSNPNPNNYVTFPFTPAMNLFQVPTTLPEQLNFLQIMP